MKDELSWQRTLVTGIRLDKGWAVRINPEHRYGTPDLFIQLKGLPAVLIETKVVHLPEIEIGTAVEIAMTKLQRETMREIQRAGGLVGVWVNIEDKYVYVGSDPDEKHIVLGKAPLICKKPGPWPVRQMVESLLSLYQASQNGTFYHGRP